MASSVCPNNSLGPCCSPECVCVCTDAVISDGGTPGTHTRTHTHTNTSLAVVVGEVRLLVLVVVEVGGGRKSAQVRFGSLARRYL